jgi:hypothetical protein
MRGKRRRKRMRRRK